MKSIVFDTSSIISLVTNDLLHVLNDLKKYFGGEFYIPNSVKYELIDKPLSSKKFKLEAMMVSKFIDSGIFTVNKELDVENLLLTANSIYSAHGKNIHILDKAEIEALALAVKMNSSVYVVDERTMRLLVEDYAKLGRLLAKKLNTRITVNKRMFKEFMEQTGKVNIIRSTELMTVAFEKGLIKNYVGEYKKEDVIDALLWGLKLRGCAISTEEINDIVKMESRL